MEKLYLTIEICDALCLCFGFSKGTELSDAIPPTIQTDSATPAQVKQHLVARTGKRLIEIALGMLE